MHLRAPASRKRPNRLVEELEDSDGFFRSAYSTDASSRATRSQPVQTMDPRLRPAFRPPTKPFNPNLPPAAFPSLPLMGPGSNPDATQQDQQPQQQKDDSGENSGQQDGTTSSERRATVLRYRKPTEEDDMDPDEMTLVQLVRREHYIQMFAQLVQASDATEVAFEELHQLMRSTIIANILSESIRLLHARDIFWPIRLLLQTERATIYGDLNYVVDVVLKGRYPYMLEDLKAEMNCAERFLQQRRLPIRFLYAFKLEIIREVLEHTDATFAAPPYPTSTGNISIKDFIPGFEPPIAPDTALDQSDLVSTYRSDRLEMGPNLLDKSTAVAVKRSDSSAPGEGAEKTVVCGTAMPTNESTSALQKSLSNDHSAVPHDKEVANVVSTMETNATSLRRSNRIRFQASRNTADVANTLNTDATNVESSNVTEPEVNKEISISSPVRHKGDLEFWVKGEGWFDEMPSPILRGLNLTLQPGLAPKTSLGHKFKGIFYDERLPELFPEVSEHFSSDSTRPQETPGAGNSTQNDVAVSSDDVTPAIDFTEVFSQVEHQQTKLKYNWVLNNLLGLGKEIQEATSTASQDTPMRGGEDMDMDIEIYDQIGLLGEETRDNLSSGLPHFGAALTPAVSNEYQLPTNTISAGSSQSLGEYIPRSLCSLPPRFMPPRHQSSGDLNGFERPAPQVGLNLPPATIAADNSNYLPGISVRLPRPSRPFQRETRSHKMTMAGASTPEQVHRQEPPSSGATIPMVNSDASPGILLPRNSQNPKRGQQARRRQNGAASPLKHVTTLSQPPTMCSSSSSTESRSPSKSLPPEPPVPRSNLLNRQSSGHLLAAFRVRTNFTSKTLPVTTLVVSNSGRDAGMASVHTTKTTRAKKNKKDDKDLTLISASLPSAGITLPISAPAYGNICLPDRTAFGGGPRTASLPSKSSILSWAAEQEVQIGEKRSSSSATPLNFNPSSASNSDDHVIHPMHPVLQPLFSTGLVSAPSTSRTKTAPSDKPPGQGKNDGNRVEEVSGRSRGGGKNLDLLRKLSVRSKLELEKQAEHSGADLPRQLVPGPSHIQEPGGGSDCPARDVVGAASESLSASQDAETETGIKRTVDKESRGGQKAPHVDIMGPASSGGSSGDEEFNRQQQIDEEARQRRLAEQQLRQQNQSAESFTPTVFPFPPYPPWHKAILDGATVDTPPPKRPRPHPRYSLSAAGGVEVGPAFTRSALSPYSTPRAPGLEGTPGITAPPIRPGRKRSYNQYLDDSEGVRDVGAGGEMTRDGNDRVMRDRE